MKFVTYFRVSTQKQGRSGLGLEAQEQAVGSYLDRIGGETLCSFTDVESGKRDNRPQLDKAITRCRLTGATLLIAKLDRLSRNKAFLFKMMDSKIQFICADMPEANELTISFMALIADYEGKAISERTKAALAAAKARGVKLGNVRNLTNRDTEKARTAKIDAANARNSEILSVIDDMVAEYGPQSLRGMAGLLNNAGYTTTRGNCWQSTSVKRVIDTRVNEYHREVA